MKLFRFLSRCLPLIITFSLLTSTAKAQVFDSYSFELGRGNDATIYKLSAQKWVAQDNAFFNTYNLHPYVELSVARINERKYQNTPGRSDSITSFGLTPVLRWQKDINQGIFGEIGIGANYMSDYYNNAGRTASTKFQFGDHIGIGYKFSNSAEVTLKYQHYSNAHIKTPNPAINFTNIKFAYTF